MSSGDHATLHVLSSMILPRCALQAFSSRLPSLQQRQRSRTPLTLEPSYTRAVALATAAAAAAARDLLSSRLAAARVARKQLSSVELHSSGASTSKVVLMGLEAA